MAPPMHASRAPHVRDSEAAWRTFGDIMIHNFLFRDRSLRPAHTRPVNLNTTYVSGNFQLMHIAARSLGRNVHEFEQLMNYYYLFRSNK